MNAADAAPLGIRTGDVVRAESRRGEITLRAWVNERVPPGLCWAAFHFAEACANALTIDAYDPVTETPEYKACAIRVTKVRPAERELEDLRRPARP